MSYLLIEKFMYLVDLLFYVGVNIYGSAKIAIIFKKIR